VSHRLRGDSGTYKGKKRVECALFYPTFQLNRTDLSALAVTTGWALLGARLRYESEQASGEKKRHS
jgi:hypothetical protein